MFLCQGLGGWYVLISCEIFPTLGSVQGHLGQDWEPPGLVEGKMVYKVTSNANQAEILCLVPSSVGKGGPRSCGDGICGCQAC